MHTMILNNDSDKSYAVGCYVHHHPGGVQDFQTVALVSGMSPGNNARIAATLVHFLNGGNAIRDILQPAINAGHVRFM